MLYMKRTTLTALVVFFPISGFVWLGAPWSTSKAEFELTETTLLSETHALFSDLNSARASTADSTAWLESGEAAQVVLDSLPHNRAASLAEFGETWSVKLRERMRALVCYQPLEAWRIRDRSVCSWLGEWLMPQTHTDQLEIIEERLSIHQFGDGRRIEISFRAADPDVATTFVDAFGEALLERHAAARRDLRSRIVETIETEIAGLTQREVALEALPSENKSITKNGKEDLDFALSVKFAAALTRARNELPVKDRHQLDGDLEAVKAAVRDQLLSPTVDRKALSLEAKGIGDGSATDPTSSVMLLGHPDWSKLPVIRLSETVTNGFPPLTIAVIAFTLSLVIGTASNAIWPRLRHRSDQRHNFYASPYANPHWPNMRVLEQAESDRAA